MKTVFLESLGCARNLVDSETMLGRLAQSGFRITRNPAEADVIVVNTCSFIEDAADESIDTILELAGYKKDGRCRQMIVTGCLPERYGKDIAENLPEVDCFLGTGAFDRIADAVQGKIETACFLPEPVPQNETGARIRTHAHMAYLKIAEGCSRHCTYCIIPKLRGVQKSRLPEHILSEAAALAASGCRELVLVSQDTTAYGKDLPGAFSLSALLSDLSALPELSDSWVRFLYGHPESIDISVIKTVARCENICSYFDMPIQHVSSDILKKMGRRYTKDRLHDIFRQIRSEVPDAVLRTTAIVGFPGETEADFEELAEFVRDVEFNHLGVFIYSDSDDLPSHRLPNHIPKRTARKRYDRLMKLQQGISLTHNRRYIGKTLRALTEEQAEPGLWVGRSAYQAPEVDGVVYIRPEDASGKSKNLKSGDFVSVRITDALEYDLIGKPA